MQECCRAVGSAVVLNFANQVELCSPPLRLRHGFVVFFFSSIFLPFWHLGAEMLPRFWRVFRCSFALAFGCEGSGADLAHIPRQMLRALRVDESLREQLETTSDIHPLMLVRRNCCSGKITGCAASQRISSLRNQRWGWLGPPFPGRQRFTGS